jgi:hypothetical protein
MAPGWIGERRARGWRSFRRKRIRYYPLDCRDLLFGAAHDCDVRVHRQACHLWINSQLPGVTNSMIRPGHKRTRLNRGRLRASALAKLS